MICISGNVITKGNHMRTKMASFVIARLRLLLYCKYTEEGLYLNLVGGVWLQESC